MGKSATLLTQLTALPVLYGRLWLDVMYWPKLLQTAGTSAAELHLPAECIYTTLKLLSVSVTVRRPDDGTAKLQHLPTGAIFTIVEPDLQSGRAVGHIVDSMLSPAQAAAVAAQKASVGVAPGGRYASVMSVLQDPVQQLLGFAGLVEQAGLAAELSELEAEMTLFVPSSEVSIEANRCADCQVILTGKCHQMGYPAVT
jgi:hypothetical protein